MEGVILVKGMKDRVIPAPSSSGKFLCKSLRRLIAMTMPLSDRWKSLLILPVLLKVKCFS